MRAWVSKGAIRLIADSELEEDMLRALPNRTFTAMPYLHRSSGYLKGRSEINLIERHIDEVRDDLTQMEQVEENETV